MTEPSLYCRTALGEIFDCHFSQPKFLIIPNSENFTSTKELDRSNIII